jgi:DNA invertase Pin-like site-specific DNA recombinase
MTNWAYLRVSTDAQDVANQKHGILEYANERGISNLVFIEDSVSGKLSWRERKLGTELLTKSTAGDIVLFAEVSRIGRSTLQVLEVLEHCTAEKITVHVVKQKMQFDGSMTARITATVLGLAAEIEREFISLRTKEALAARKKDGVTLGRPHGESAKLKLDAHEREIKSHLAKGITKSNISRLLNVSRQTLDAWLKKRNISVKLKPSAVNKVKN